ncbi:hypothetical protein ASPWEDRAFT_171303 [Aspergillus wentii DTO 134E9]|uniref:Zn(2)-C6 fungal-type domain-containing protein n=1 Tax=Aspergillus wentii DTO 134E9 TaxID=1073089 RepID=A0A1L9RSE6_ASPWE|nr:uncharacterized protein ASPWEDRAFT_171303 [Aspergillus wentii DTO 134E9]KAI9930679.1 hypothetical protein MW887_011434 [Aspergillus wentii]OJJ37842.1 hypothetical protein ASPWEDRAFT_171303 [Aspergillus wentii DTO 134E9]
MGTQKPALRASCDNCHRAKVKCVPVSTAGCHRCLTLNAKCIHSPPGRSGRTPSGRKNSASSAYPALNTEEYGDAALSLDGAVDSTLSGWLSMPPTPSLEESVYTQLPIAPETPSLSTILMDPFSETGNTSTHPCGCCTSILRALETVQQTDVNSLSLDVALARNKDALVHICTSIKCTLPHDSTTRLLILILLRKTLQLYKHLYQNRLKGRPAVSSPGYSVSGSDYDYFNVPSYTQPESSGTAPQIARLTLGTYQLDDADERSLTKQILLLDVVKVPRLLERLDQRACGLDEADGLDLYNMMRSSLIADFRGAMADLQS